MFRGDICIATNSNNHRDDVTINEAIIDTIWNITWNVYGTTENEVEIKIGSRPYKIENAKVVI
jgi:hypothetical protein